MVRVAAVHMEGAPDEPVYRDNGTDPYAKERKGQSPITQARTFTSQFHGCTEHGVQAFCHVVGCQCVINDCDLLKG
jgi:hypothetical protein